MVTSWAAWSPCRLKWCSPSGLYTAKGGREGGEGLLAPLSRLHTPLLRRMPCTASTASEDAQTSAADDDRPDPVHEDGLLLAQARSGRAWQRTPGAPRSVTRVTREPGQVH